MFQMKFGDVRKFRMNKIDIVCIGKLKETYLINAMDEYSKRLKSYCKLTIIEQADEKIHEKMSKKQEILLKQKEGEKILTKVADNGFVIALDIDGEMLGSVELTRFLEEKANRGHSHIVFIIGGSLGLCDKVLSRANYKLSFSKMTFPHQLFRVMLIEQIYRVYKIRLNETYHK